MDFLQTGDLVLFRGNSWISMLLHWFGRSSYSHVGMIVRNPSFLDPNLDDGVYLLESGRNSFPDAENHQEKTGVQLNLLSDVLSECTNHSVVVRKVDCLRDVSFYQRLADLHKRIHNKPYDVNPWDWLWAEYNLFYPLSIDEQYRKDQSFWCSALVAYLYDQLELIDPVNWTLISPREFSERGVQLRFRCVVHKEESL